MQNPYRALSKVNPQKEGHHREIANDVFHALMAARLSGGEYQVVLTVIDRTWGFGKLSELISLSKFQEATLLSRQGVINAIQSLDTKHIIAVNHTWGTNPKKATEYLFNKHYDTWDIPQPSQPEFTSNKGAPSQQEMPNQQAQLVNHSRPVAEPVLVNHSLLEQSTTVDQSGKPELTSTSQLPEPTTEPVKKKKETIIETLKENISVVFDHWNSLKIIKHKNITDRMKTALKSALKSYTNEEICQAMRNYAEVLHGEDYFWQYRWTFDEFLRRGLEKFMDGEVARENYRIREERRDERPQKGVRPKPRQERAGPITYIKGSGEDPGKD